MDTLTKTQNLTDAAMLSGMDRKTARGYRDSGALPSESETTHTWRTRSNPFAEVWAEVELSPLIRTDYAAILASYSAGQQ